jgi:RNA polymerase sigma-70 factor, ECF subfamily
MMVRGRTDLPQPVSMVRRGVPISSRPPAEANAGLSRDLTEEFVRNAQHGDAEAFEVLVDRYAAEMYRVASAIVGPDDGRDVTQEAFVAAWRELPRLHDPNRFTGWLRRIVVNRSRNVLRSRRRHPAEPLDMDAALSLPSATDFRDAIHAKDELDGAFDALPADQLTVLILHYGAGLRLSEVADATGARLGTVKSRLNAALRRMRLLLEART